MQIQIFTDSTHYKQVDSHFSVGEVKLKYRPVTKCSPKITSSKDCYEILKKIYNRDTISLNEQFVVLFLDRNNKVLGHSILSIGGIGGTVADQRLLFQRALLMNASGIILSHNHPSGNLNPSTADIGLTKKVIATGKILEIQVLDHLILINEGYRSMADERDVTF
ncbi:MAG: JAB domain-containing protein [Cyclobacteriaceae bacterium]